MEIEIDSTYRNRVLYPNPCSFELLVNTPNKTFISALDPVSKAAPQRTFVGNTLDPLISNVITITGTIVRIIPNAVEVVFPGQIFQEKNYYTGLITDNNITITKYEFVYANCGRFFLNNVSPTLAVGNLFNVYYWPQIEPLNVAGLYVKFFVPAKPTCNHVRLLYNEIKHNWNEIVMSDNFSVTVFIQNTNWAYDDTYSLRDEPPIWYGTVAANTSNTITFGSVDPAQRDFVYVSSLNYYGKITSQLGPTVTVTPNIVGFITPGDEAQCLQFSYDNSQSLPYIGTPDQQQRTWLIELINIQIPNIPIKNKTSLLQYSHLYIEFRDPLSSPQNNIMSNNPHSNNSYFRVVLSKMQSTREWLSYDCDGSKKTIRFTPTSMFFRFKILTPDGEVVEFLEQESTWPQKALSRIQVSALFNVLDKQ
jgi:hypothetical protein